MVAMGMLYKARMKNVHDNCSASPRAVDVLQ